jgi:hypothetical protein
METGSCNHLLVKASNIIAIPVERLPVEAILVIALPEGGTRCIKKES